MIRPKYKILDDKNLISNLRKAFMVNKDDFLHNALSPVNLQQLRLVGKL